MGLRVSPPQCEGTGPKTFADRCSCGDPRWLRLERDLTFCRTDGGVDLETQVVCP